MTNKCSIGEDFWKKWVLNLNHVSIIESKRYQQEGKRFNTFVRKWIKLSNHSKKPTRELLSGENNFGSKKNLRI